MNFFEQILVTDQVRLEWYESISGIIHKGIPLTDALKDMERDFKKVRHPLSPLIKEVNRRLRGGSGQALSITASLKGLIPQGEYMLIHAGESSGNLEAGFTNAKKTIENKEKLTKTLTASLIKPLMYIAALIVLLLFFSIKVLPGFEEVKPRYEWPYSAQLFAQVADMSVYISIGIVAFIAAVFFGIRFLLPRWTGESREFADRNIPIFGLMSQIESTRFLNSIEGYISAGVPLSDAIKHIRSGSSNYIQYQCELVMRSIRQGKTTAQALTALSMIPPKYHWIINVYSRMGSDSKAFLIIVEKIEKTVFSRLQFIFGNVLSSLLLALVGGVIGWVYMSLLSITQ
ncbi:type II secretion system F family protein [Thiomicrorhabdus indica]|uniref:type II secretion system F family protein n=1 Tax=Thiomicrorhabdus indica TaxID=2267253 RepID=UPI00102DBBB2|nr:type II secretion system F family protein [Thiomicrorhabdus indica]